MTERVRRFRPVFKDVSVPIMQRKECEAGHYDFLPGIPAFSCGVRAHEGFEIVRAVFANLVPWQEGCDLLGRHLASAGLEPPALCSVELRCSRPYSARGFDAFNETYIGRLLSMGVFRKDEINPVGRTNVSPVAHAPDEQSMYAFSYTRPATADAKPSFVIAGGGEVRGGSIDPDAIVRYGDVSEAGVLEKAAFMLDVMEKRLEGLALTWDDVRTVNVYTKHEFDESVSKLVDKRVGIGSLHGIHRYRTAPPVEHIEFEMDVKGPVWELALA